MKKVMDEAMIARTLKRLAHEIMERNPDLNDVVLIGIKTRGEALANRLQRNIRIMSGQEVTTYNVDFRPWRDDVVRDDVVKMDAHYDVKDKTVILVDDVLFEGRTIRSALDGVMSFGRAKKIEVVVLVDRGHRVLPIKADYVGKNVPTSIDETVDVRLKEYDGDDEVIIHS